MRSDRNPYFLYKNKKDPHIQQLLAQAPTLTDAQIFALTPKPDLRKAMQFVRDMGTQTKSVHTAELLAARMMQMATPTHTVAEYDLWHYKGGQIVLSTQTRSQLIMQDFLFLYADTKIWVSHNWCMIPQDQHMFWSCCEKLGRADHTEYNRQIQVYLARKHQGIAH